jgi:hypothetical protein
MADEKNTLNIGTQNIDLDAIRQLSREDLVKALETIYFDGYQQALKTLDTKISENIEQLISLKRDTNVKQEQAPVTNTTTTPTETPVVTTPVAPVVNDGKIQINIGGTEEKGPIDPLQQRMNEIADMVYKFKNPGFVIYRHNGTEDEYLKSKYGFTTLPMKALVFDTEAEALTHKEMYWGSGYDELFIRQV